MPKHFLFAALLLTIAACREPRGIRVVAGPSPLPDRVVTTFEGDPCSTRSATWRTDDSVERAHLEWTETDLGGPRLGATSIHRLEAQTSVLALDLSDWNAELDYQQTHYHSARMTDLAARTLYAYRVGSGKAWSEWHHFRTPPCASPEAESFRFLYFGDLQNGILSHGARVVRSAYARAPDAAFALYAGDLVNDGHSDLDWARWFDVGGWMHATLPVVPVVGNHEVRSLDRARQGPQQLAIHWRQQFALPVVEQLPEALAETVYSFDVGAARFFVLNTSFGQDEQGAWLVGELERAAADGVRWKIVSFHFPTFSNTADRDNPELRAFVRPLFSRYGVDLVLQGHDHSYSRGHDPAFTEFDSDSGTPSHQEEPGPIYVVSIAGAKQYRIGLPMWSTVASESRAPVLDRRGENTQFFQVIEVSPKALSYRAYTAAEELYDGFDVLVTDGGKRLQQLPVIEEPSREFDGG